GQAAWRRAGSCFRRITRATFDATDRASQAHGARARRIARHPPRRARMTPMIALGWALIAAVARATALAALGAGLYVAARRRGPNVGSAAVLMSLVGLLALPLLAAGSWPVWGRIDVTRLIPRGEPVLGLAETSPGQKLNESRVTSNPPPTAALSDLR